MKSIIVILKEVKRMDKNRLWGEIGLWKNHILHLRDSWYVRENRPHPFWVMVQKEIRDHILSWRFLIMLVLIVLTCMGSLYTSISSLPRTVKQNDPQATFFFLKLFTLSDGSLPPFHVFVGFLGPLLGIALGFDAINSEQNRGTLSRIMAQPVHRDYLINAKFVAALIVISVLFLALGLLVMGLGMIIVGFPPTVEEFLRVIAFIVISIVYVAFWLNLSILFSIRFRQAATSALTSIAVWLFFTIFYQIIISLVAKAMMPGEGASEQEMIHFQNTMLNLLRLVPSQLFSDATTTLLMPAVRSLGPLSMEQMYGAIPGPLPFTQSLLLVWPQLTGLLSATVVCFALSYLLFMRKEIRSRE